MSALIPVDFVERRIYFLRANKVMLDSDLAKLYGVPTKSVNRAVRRNRVRFPEDFMFQLTPEEVQDLRYQIGTSNPPDGRGGRRYTPFVFTEQGVAMLSSVLKSNRAAVVNIAIMRAFVKLRHVISTHQELGKKLEQLEVKYRRNDGRLKKHDVQIKKLFDGIWKLMNPAKTKIGFSK